MDTLRRNKVAFILIILLCHGFNSVISADSDSGVEELHKDCDEKIGEEKCKCYKEQNNSGGNCENDKDYDSDDEESDAWWIALTVVLSVIVVISVVVIYLAWKGYCCCCPRYTKAYHSSSSVAAPAAAGGGHEGSTNVYTIQAPPAYIDQPSNTTWAPPHYKMDRMEVGDNRAPSAPPPPYEQASSDIYINIIE